MTPPVNRECPCWRKMPLSANAPTLRELADEIAKSWTPHRHDVRTCGECRNHARCDLMAECPCWAAGAHAERFASDRLCPTCGSSLVPGTGVSTGSLVCASGHYSEHGYSEPPQEPDLRGAIGRDPTIEQVSATVKTMIRSVADRQALERLTMENATEREQLAYGRGWNHKAIDGSHIPGSEAER